MKQENEPMEASQCTECQTMYFHRQTMEGRKKHWGHAQVARKVFAVFKNQVAGEHHRKAQPRPLRELSVCIVLELLPVLPHHTDL